MARGRARIAMAHGLGVWVLDAPEGFGDPGFHAHHALQVTVALAGGFSVETAEATLAGPAVAVASDAAHRMTGTGLIAIVFADPDSPAGRAMAATLFGGRAAAPLDEPGLLRALAPLARTFNVSLDSAALLAAGRAALEQFAAAPLAPPDARIEAIVRRLPARLGATLGEAAAAEGVFLSPERLRHLFVEHTGLPYKTYMLWLRLNRALREYADGRSLTEAAHAAGFADSAHLSRVFRRTFGLPATALERF